METVIMPAEDRVRNSTSDCINKKIDKKILDNVEYYSSSAPDDIERRMKELDIEWDIERTLELNASVVALTGIILAATVNKKWLILPGIVTTFLAQHAIQGWCPPLPLFRRLGIRTQKEIDAERHALADLLKK